VCLETGQ